MQKKKIKDLMNFQVPLMGVILGCIISNLMLISWFESNRTPVEPEVIVETKLVYVYKEADLPEEFVPEEIPEPEPLPKYGFTEDEIYLMTVLLCGSGKTDGDGEYDIDFANSENHEQISLVLSVVMNRVMSDKFPNTVAEVIWAPGQFSPMPRWKQGLPKVKEESYQIVKAWCEAYDTHDMSIMSIPESHLYFTGNGKINISRERW
jgi:hypothetical protein